MSHFPLLLTHLDSLLSQPANAHLDARDRATELARLYADILVAYGRAAMARTGAEMEEIDGQVVKSWKTPFELEAKTQGLRYEGGKVDEWVLMLGLTDFSITVVTAVVSEKNPES